MNYRDGGSDIRDLFFYDFRSTKKINIKTFKQSDGMLSNFKILKSDFLDEAGSYIFFVRNTTDVYRFNADKEGQEEFIGKVSDSVIAMSVSTRNLRMKD